MKAKEREKLDLLRRNFRELAVFLFCYNRRRDLKAISKSFGHVLSINCIFHCDYNHYDL